jgi:uncharacterized protein YukE
MTRAIVDPREVRRFSALLSETAASLQAGKSDVTGQFNDLKGVWKDTKYGQFEKTFADTMSRLQAFLKTAESYANYLNTKARLAERYFD